MHFVDHTLTWDWCRQHGFPVRESDGQVGPRLIEDPSLAHQERLVHDAAGNAADSAKIAARIIRSLGEWDELLAWATDWDVWEYEEDWPRYYGWRAQHGERRSLRAAPGHLFVAGEGSDLATFLAHAIECGWDVTLLPTRAGQPTGCRVKTSHDEWVEFQARTSVGFEPPAS